MSTEELIERIKDLESVMVVFAQYASDTWVREEAEKTLANDPS